MNDKAFIIKDHEKQIIAAYDRLMYSGANDTLWPIKKGPELCKPLGFSIKRDGNGNTIAVADKMGTIGVFCQKAKKWTAVEGSKLTLDEFETFSDKGVVATLLDTPAAKSAYGEDAMLPDGLIPIAEAVEIVSRDMGSIHDLITGYLDGSLPKPLLTVKEVNKLISDIGDPDKTRMLQALAIALDKVRNSPGVNSSLTYENFLIEHPFGADKLLHALCVDYWVINHEQKVLTSTNALRSSLREKIVYEGVRYTEAIRKVVGKMVLAGFIPWVSLEVMQIREELINRPMFFRD